MSNILAFPPKLGATPLPVSTKRCQFIAVHHALQALCWTEYVNAELILLNLPPDPVDQDEKAALRHYLDELAAQLMPIPARCEQDLEFKRAVKARAFDVTWEPAWDDQLRQDEARAPEFLAE
ncbi:hypothetical protein [Sandaracinobacteroides hominis]|uniref:hypothetical protein n=1 Tax=Sandaracinobacteroides hominis TaxID=2780086 RepID=UPI0018F6B1FF|nr:hypothetical protein [Sandaracinobacteroides hominis]